jgi:hypothetical protein
LFPKEGTVVLQILEVAVGVNKLFRAVSIRPTFVLVRLVLATGSLSVVASLAEMGVEREVDMAIQQLFYHADGRVPIFTPTELQSSIVTMLFHLKTPARPWCPWHETPPRYQGPVLRCSHCNNSLVPCMYAEVTRFFLGYLGTLLGRGRLMDVMSESAMFPAEVTRKMGGSFLFCLYNIGVCGLRGAALLRDPPQPADPVALVVRAIRQRDLLDAVTVPFTENPYRPPTPFARDTHIIPAAKYRVPTEDEASIEELNEDESDNEVVFGSEAADENEVSVSVEYPDSADEAATSADEGLDDAETEPEEVEVEEIEVSEVSQIEEDFAEVSMDQFLTESALPVPATLDETDLPAILHL